jgi:hypothetical protein
MKPEQNNMNTPTPSPYATDGQRTTDAECSARLSFIRVTTKGCKGTINLLWDDYPVAWVNNVQIAREMMREIPEQNVKVEARGE